MSPDVWRMLAAAGVLWAVGSTIIGIMIGSAITRWRERRRKALAAQHRAAFAPTAVFRPAQWRDLWDQVEDETALLRRVDPTALPKPRRSRLYSAGRRLR